MQEVERLDINVGIDEFQRFVNPQRHPQTMENIAENTYVIDEFLVVSRERNNLIAHSLCRRLWSEPSPVKCSFEVTSYALALPASACGHLSRSQQEPREPIRMGACGKNVDLIVFRACWRAGLRFNASVA